jgi:DNA repair exonuclease SbcCD ATPase subunit
VLAVLEAAMVPLMAELAMTRQACKEYCAEQGEAFMLQPTADSSAEAGETAAQSISAVEAEIKHLQVDLTHFQRKAERLQVEERQRSHEISRLCGELSEAYEHLAYEQKCVRHHEVSRQFGIDPAGGGWAGMGPCGVGRRTMEVRQEQKLREHAEQRGGRLARDVTKLGSDTSQQQACIAQLGARLMRVKKAHAERDRRLTHNIKQTSFLHAKLKVTSGESQPSPDGTEPSQGKDAGATGNDAEGGASLRRTKKKPVASSTGKLPQLSF